MDTITGILALAAFIGMGILITKAQNSLGRNLNRKLLFKRDYEEGLSLIEPLCCTIKAPASDLLEALSTTVTAQNTPPDTLNAVVYCAHSSKDKVIYRLGNKLVPKSFELVLSLAEIDQTTAVDLRVVSWTESAGMIKWQDEMRQLKSQIETSIYKFENIHNKGE